LERALVQPFYNAYMFIESEWIRTYEAHRLGYDTRVKYHNPLRGVCKQSTPPNFVTTSFEATTNSDYLCFYFGCVNRLNLKVALLLFTIMAIVFLVVFFGMLALLHAKYPLTSGGTASSV